MGFATHLESTERPEVEVMWRTMLEPRKNVKESWPEVALTMMMKIIIKKKQTKKKVNLLEMLPSLPKVKVKMEHLQLLQSFRKTPTPMKESVMVLVIWEVVNHLN